MRAIDEVAENIRAAKMYRESIWAQKLFDEKYVKTLSVPYCAKCLEEMSLLRNQEIFECSNCGQQIFYGKKE